MAINHPEIINLSIILTTIFLISTTSNSETIYEILETHGLPTGVFPKGISNFSVDPLNGRFEFHLSIPSSCDAKFETSVRYDSNVSGVIEFGKIGELKGMAAQELFLWLPVNEIRVDVPSSGLIYFDVGVVSKQFSMAYFEAPLDCVVVSRSENVEMVDVSFLRWRNRFDQNQPGKGMNEDYSGRERKAVS